LRISSSIDRLSHLPIQWIDHLYIYPQYEALCLTFFSPFVIIEIFLYC